jgi:hypothetical protein
MTLTGAERMREAGHEEGLRRCMSVACTFTFCFDSTIYVFMLSTMYDT